MCKAFAAMEMYIFQAFCLEMKWVALCLLILCRTIAASSNETVEYDTSTYTECQIHPAAPLYGGGILVNPGFEDGTQGWTELIGKANLHIESENNGNKYVVATNRQMGNWTPSQKLENLSQDIKYTLSAWVQIRGAANSAFVKATVDIDNTTSLCAGNVMARNGCWSFLKGGFVPDWSPSYSKLYFESNNTDVDILVDSVSIQPFTEEEWCLQQQDRITKNRMRRVSLHVTDLQGNRLEEANVTVKQISRQFPLGSAITKTILGNEPYQRWFLKRFNTAVFENELKWYATEPKPGKLNYSLADQLLEFCDANGIQTRGHNIFWEDSRYIPSWVTSLDKEELQKAVRKRIESLVERYAGNFISWDVSNEMLHFSFYEEKLGPDASQDFFQAAQQIDPRTPMFMNDYNVIEDCADSEATADAYIQKLRKIRESGQVMEGIGLESHFSKPNIPFMRAVLEKLSTLGLPIWLTEVDVAKKFDHETQAAYLEEILREGFSFPAVEGIIMWTALGRNGCYQMCLTDNDFNNLPAGDSVDRLLAEWTTELDDMTDENGLFKFNGFFGDYEFSATYGQKNITKSMSVSQGDGVQHIYIQI
ncbi:endo-1,4-beta-xylanase 5 [Cryptomeria japonica]|uniref:endo-1,4-beta-xylanase 5 n=1 Tax=Cryptomeria japonica TaxID=3369 RepID=UPI0027DA9A67|nr:endo-1,4-beta-xylanase 5 [Cryptomeria japonica]